MMMGRVICLHVPWDTSLLCNEWQVLLIPGIIMKEKRLQCLTKSFRWTAYSRNGPSAINFVLPSFLTKTLP